MSDLISRKNAIEAIVNIISDLGNHDNSEVARFGAAFRQLEIIGILQALPSAETERKKGKWIECDSSEHWKCSECGCRASYWFNEENSSSYDLDMSEWLSDFCPNCGARMVGEEE